MMLPVIDCLFFLRLHLSRLWSFWQFGLNLEHLNSVILSPGFSLCLWWWNELVGKWQLVLAGFFDAFGYIEEMVDFLGNQAFISLYCIVPSCCMYCSVFFCISSNTASSRLQMMQKRCRAVILEVWNHVSVSILDMKYQL